MDRFQQLMFRSKQSGSEKVLKREPKLNELSEGVAVFAHTNKGLRQYTKYNNVIYESAFNTINKVDNIATPDYDSGWITVDNGSSTSAHVDFTHNLGSKILLIQIYLKDTGNSDRIFNITANFEAGYGTDDVGLWFYHETVNNIACCPGNTYIFKYDNTPHSASAVDVDQADIRILAWKTGVGE